ncbi:GNAT family N-acetyltransferase [Cellulomonas sp. PhB150]|uniref:GNAT family N-acetyltransferase n=1 Tax=Cellulomonas sp. PhB150 TaxID=2485188 RepID=UPI000F4950A7|nr:GNAT family N-acetyltransferase [Cellulomonas sp. PhB150]ROS23790.1 acetyltransferase (GNAT) family protein [Cellulomonas sp. PhB150]
MWTLREVDGRDPRLLDAYVEAANTVVVDTWGVTDFCRNAREVAGSLRDQQYELKWRRVALDEDGNPVGYAALNLPQQDNTHTGYLEVGTVPGARRQGIGSALYGEVIAAARAAGRTKVLASTDQAVEPPAGPGTLTAPTGEGRVATDAAPVRFATSRGWRLEQVERRSVLDVPLDPDVLAEHRMKAEQVGGDEYRVITWTDRCPDEWLDQFAILQTRMSTDVPTAGLDWGEESWDGPRVRAREAEFADRGMSYPTVAAEHVPTGTLVGYSSFLVVPHTDEYVHQHDTLVVREHRGRRLGMLLKAANLQRLPQELPNVRRIGTWNAEENAPMLSINIELGFRPAGGAGEWQLDLA